jgi:hypothetical protein
MDERRELMHIILIHEFSHTALNYMGKTTGQQLRVPVATLVKQRAMPSRYRLICVVFTI